MGFTVLFSLISILTGCTDKQDEFGLYSGTSTTELPNKEEDTGVEVFDTGADTIDTNDTTDTTTACATPEETKDSNPMDLIGDADCGVLVYESTCEHCHGVNGQGGGSKQLNGNISNLSDSDIYDIIQNGKSGMPAQQLHPQEVADVVAFMRGAF